MKKKELMEIIQLAVRKELRTSLPAIVKECLSEIQTPTAPKKKSRVTDPVELAKRALSTESSTEVRVEKKKPPMVQYSKNSAINEILNNTSGGIPQEGSRVGGHANEQEQMTDLQGNVVDMDQLPDSVSSALTKNYTELLAAVDKKRGVGGGV
tara:strand:- start:3141 stop:3599 length:459 start_codon:yes stop_codon:yes gene_type:complete